MTNTLDHLKSVRDRLASTVAYIDEELARSAGDAGSTVLVGHERWRQEDVLQLVERVVHLPAAKALLVLCSEHAEQWVTYETVHVEAGNTNPRQTQNELSALTRHVRKLRGTGGWPVTVEGGPPLRYKADSKMAEWLRDALASHSVQMRSDRYAHNMAIWAAEKMESVVRDAAALVDLTRSNRSLSEAQRESFLHVLTKLLHDSTKVLAFTVDAEWDTGDRDLLIDQGGLGFQALAARWKLSLEPRSVHHEE